jgi:hypothetical protein
MSAAILRHPAYVEWPADPRDRLPLTLWDARSIAEAVGGTASHDFQVAGVEMDSRDVVNGDLFVALKGEAMDGHRFLGTAFANGAAGAMVVMTATCGRTCVVSSAISPAWFMPISNTPNRLRAGIRARLSGTPTWLL